MSLAPTVPGVTPLPDLCHRCGKPVATSGGLCRRCVAKAVFQEAIASPSAPPDSATELRVHDYADYEVIEELARGGMGVVYRAQQKSLGREVALKVLREVTISDGTGAERFRAEAAAAASLHHPNIVAIHGYGEHNGQPFYSMELIAGKSLAELTREGPLPARRAAELVARIAHAVQHAHDQGVLHRDLKPSNVLVDLNGEPHVTDFGLARRLDDTNHLTLTGQVLGTPGYMAPEQAFGRSRDVGVTADVYSLGAILFHLLTGRAPFVAESPTQVLAQLERDEVIAPRVLNPSVPKDLETLTLKALSKEPARRYAHAADLTGELERYLRGEPILARPLGWSGRGWRWCRRRPAVATLTALAALLVTAGVTGVSVANRRLNTQREAAERVKSFLQEILASADPTRDGRDVRVVDLLAPAAQRAARELADQPLVRAEIEQTLGTTYYQLSLYEEAEPLLRSALALHEQELGREHWKTATVRGGLGAMLGWANQNKEAIQQLQQAATTLRQSSPTHDLRLTQTLEDLGSCLLGAGEIQSAIPPLREAVERGRRLGPEVNHTLAAAYGDLANALGYDPTTLEESRRWLREGIAMNRRLPDGKVNLATGLSNLAEDLWLADQLAEAEAAAREALQLRVELFGTNATPTAFTHARLATILRARTNQVEALSHAVQAVAIQRALLPAQHRDLHFGLRVLGNVQLDAGRLPEAEASFRESREICRLAFGETHRSTRNLDGFLAETLAARGHLAEAAGLASAPLEELRKQAMMYPANVHLKRRIERLSALAAAAPASPPPRRD